jgi:hypothetical protein
MDVNPIEVQKALKGVDYPATAEELVEHAEENDADEEIIDALRTLEGHFDSPAEVQEALE